MREGMEYNEALLKYNSDKGVVYKITNKKNGKFYIGSTSRTAWKRWAGDYGSLVYADAVDTIPKNEIEELTRINHKEKKVGFRQKEILSQKYYSFEILDSSKNFRFNEGELINKLKPQLNKANPCMGRLPNLTDVEIRELEDRQREHEEKMRIERALQSSTKSIVWQWKFYGFTDIDIMDAIVKAIKE